MQDSTDNINTEFTDQSWLKMQTLLDEHMPVKRVERDWKVPFLICLSTVLLLSSVGLAYLYKTHPLIKEIIVEKVVIQKEYISTENDPTPISSKSVTQEVVSNLKSDKALLESDGKSSIHHNIGSELRPPLSEDQSINTEENSLEHTQRIQKPTTIGAINTALTSRPLDAGLGFEKTEDQQEESKAKRKLLKFELGVLLSMSQDLQFSGIGLVSGVQFPISNRFSLNTGLGINSFNGERRILGGGSEPTSLSDIYSQGLKNFKQVYVPLSLDYSVTSAIVLNSGIRLRYTYSEEIDPTLNKFIPPSPGGRSPIYNDVSVFNNTNLGFTAGVKYNFNPHWSILLDSEWGMSNLIDRTQFFGSSELKYELNLVSLRTNFTF